MDTVGLVREGAREAKDKVSPILEKKKRSEKHVTFAAPNQLSYTSSLMLNSWFSIKSDEDDDLPTRSAEELTPEEVWGIIKNIILKPLAVGLLMEVGHLAVISVLKHKFE